MKTIIIIIIIIIIIMEKNYTIYPIKNINKLDYYLKYCSRF